eukprot:2776429-Prymnesium_polylepis.1
MRARRCAERASASGLGETRPFVTATPTKSTTADSLDTVPTAGGPTRRPAADPKKLRLTVGGP